MAALKRVAIALLVVSLVAVGTLVILVGVYAYNKEPLPAQDQCVARVQEQSVALDTTQAHYASIIVGVATQRGLVPRASTIALATVYQESGIRNLDYGDRDSLGLFQQRPSQGWGTAEQVMDPYYAAGAFYDVLLTIDGWSVGNVNDVAQAVQRSGHPNGYARHVENARRLASSLTGETPASFSCVVRHPAQPDPEGLISFLDQTLPAATHFTTREDGTILVTSTSNQAAWSAAQITVANAGRYGVAGVEVAGRSWTASSRSLAPWLGENTNGTSVVISFLDQDSARPTP